ncbi:unnamed protein product [Mycena citricolor]|uniref:Acid phosphatase n=1 Tax=Mycena citricolor TaxID=2018698 RepID=A0AAD2HMN7_9AGAR|nr:unnamed protein product [Mycena citricolor]CAK5276782.1 unnamed protein product [Mycena citricolor]
MSAFRVLAAALFAVSSVQVATAASAQIFAPPSTNPIAQSGNYTGFSNSTLKPNNHHIKKGKVFDRIIQVWMENTDFSSAASTAAFQSLAAQGILLTNFNGVTHPSEPNYIAAMGGDHFGLHDDNMYHIPSNITTVVDLLEDEDVSWSAYQENMPEVGYFGFLHASKNYISPGLAPYNYYVRKHNPPIIFDAIAGEPERVSRIRNFNDFANDVVNGTLSQWIFVTPNMVNDAHDTSIDFGAAFLEYWLMPLLTDPRVNGEKTLILLTFDENETYGEQNTIYTVALGTAIPLELRGTTDDTFYTHYSTISTVQANWNLKTLGRQDANETVASVFDFVAKKVGHKNKAISPAQIPLLNLTGHYPGPLNPSMYQNFAAPNPDARSPTGRGVLYREGVDKHLTLEHLAAPVNLTAKNTTTPWQMNVKSTSLKGMIPCTNAACS